MDAPLAQTYSSDSAQFGLHLDRGSYRLLDVEPGDYVLRFSDDRGTYATTSYAAGEPFTATAGSNDLDDTTMSLAPPEATVPLTGQVLGANNSPALGTYVELFRVKNDRSFFLHEATTNDNGEFSIPAAPTGVDLAVCTFTDQGFVWRE